MKVISFQYLSEEEEEDLTTTATNLANKQKKELAKVDHAGVEYSPFRKSFYTEVPEIAKMTPEEVELYREVCYIFFMEWIIDILFYYNLHLNI